MGWTIGGRRGRTWLWFGVFNSLGVVLNAARMEFEMSEMLLRALICRISPSVVWFVEAVRCLQVC